MDYLTPKGSFIIILSTVECLICLTTNFIVVLFAMEVVPKVAYGWSNWSKRGRGGREGCQLGSLRMLICGESSLLFWGAGLSPWLNCTFKKSSNRETSNCVCVCVCFVLRSSLLPWREGRMQALSSEYKLTKLIL